MAYITREDGERFVIPSYRDVITVKKASMLRREILTLSESYGEYIALQRKNETTYEVAFSPDTGYLLGETVWHYFKRPQDLIYCEAIPNTSEAILVIVKSGSVYLDGSFPIDAIPDELVIFRTQQTAFDIYIYGDVPISDTTEDYDKFALEADAVKSFNILTEPVFPKLPTISAFQLQLVDNVLRTKAFAGLPIKSILSLIVLLGLIWFAWNYISSHKKELPQVIVAAVNPYQSYLNILSTPDPAEQVRWVATNVWLLSTIPGWFADGVEYADGKLHASVKSKGVRTNVLFDWSVQNHMYIDITNTGVFLVMETRFPRRSPPNFISPLNNVIATLIDSMSYIIPGNNLTLGNLIERGRFQERQVDINFNDITFQTLDYIGQQLKNLPLTLVKITIKISPIGNLNGTISLRAYGN